DAADFGVPQHRERLVVIGIKDELVKTFPAGCIGLFDRVDVVGKRQLEALGDGEHVSAKQAISDLEVGDGNAKISNTVEYAGPRDGYLQKKYRGPSSHPYQALMHDGVGVSGMDSMRLARHRP